MTKKQQAGASTLGILIVVLFFGSLLTLLIKLGPAYLDDYTVKEALQGLDGTENLARMTPADIRNLVSRRMSVNNVTGFDARDIVIERDGDRVVLSVDYEVRTSVIYNIDAVMSFSHRYELTGK